jgi:hypothetical protein
VWWRQEQPTHVLIGAEPIVRRAKVNEQLRCHGFVKLNLFSSLLMLAPRPTKRFDWLDAYRLVGTVEE